MNYSAASDRVVHMYVFGALFITVAGMMGRGILTYNPRLSSWGTVTTLAADKAWFYTLMNFQADLMLQTFGIGGMVCISAMIVWGGFLLFRRRISHPKSRFLLMLMAAAIMSVMGAALNVPLSNTFPTVSEVWPAQFGGALGALILNHIAYMVKALPEYVYILLMSAVTLLGISSWILSLGFTNQQIKAGLHHIKTAVVLAAYYTYIAIRFIMHVLQVIVQTIQAKRAQQTRLPLSKLPHEEVAESVVMSDTTPPWEEDKKPVEVKKGIVESFKEKALKKPNLPKAVKARGDYQPPSLDLLTPPSPSIKDASLSRKALEDNAEKLMRVLNEFGVKGRILGVKPGPVVTLYELEPAAGVKSSRIIGLADDIARSMSARSARVSVIPGRNAMGIELPNEHRETVYFREILSSNHFQDNLSQLPLGLGKDIGGHPIITDLTKMPHLLVAGTTGSGKSVGVNAMILSLLFKLSPDECKFIMIDPKMLELSVYDGIPHLLSPVVTEPKKAIVALKWVVQEMESRYRAMAQLSVRNIQGYNDKLRKAMAEGEVLSRRVQTGFDRETGAPIFEDQPLDMTLFPYIVVVVDEMADLMLVAGKEIEAAVQRLAQMARAAGIHLIMATQRPSVDVITGTIKANFPTRISFQVTSKIDSRTILGEQGAEQLLGRGDMLYMEPGGRIRRVHGAFVGDEEVERIVAQLKVQQDPNYVDIYAVSEDSGGGYADDMMTMGQGSGDELYDKALSIVLSEGKVSTSFVQRYLNIGYNRAAKIVERMEKEGVISASNHAGKREILVPNEKG